VISPGIAECFWGLLVGVIQYDMDYLNPIHDRNWSFGGTGDRVETTRTFPSEDHG